MEKILEKLGDPGLYHVLIACLFAITWWSVTLGNVSMAFSGFTPNHTCDVAASAKLNNHSHLLFPNSALVGNSSPTHNFTVSTAKDQCFYTLNGDWEGNGKAQPCHKWLFDDEHRGTVTITTEVGGKCY